MQFQWKKKAAFFPRSFIGVVSLVEKSTLFPRTFFDVFSLVEISTLFLPYTVSPCFYLFFFDVLKTRKRLWKHLWRFSCVCNFKQSTFAILFSLNFLSKSTWCSPVLLEIDTIAKRIALSYFSMYLQNNYPTK